MIDVFDYRHAGKGFGSGAYWSPPFAGSRNELSDFRFPRRIWKRILPARCIERTHPRQHAVEGEAFDPLGTAMPIYRNRQAHSSRASHRGHVEPKENKFFHSVQVECNYAIAHRT